MSLHQDDEDTGRSRSVAFKAVGVKKHYPGVKALDGVDLEGYAGSVLAVCGANGAGKSTFAKLLAGVETPTDGEITVTGFAHPVRNADHRMNLLRRQRIHLARPQPPERREPLNVLR